MLKSSGAAGIIHKGNGVQVIYGPSVTVVKSNLDDYLATAPDDPIPAVQPPEAKPAGKKPKSAGGQKEIRLYAPLTGKIVPLDQVEDEVFSQEILGPGHGH